MKDEEATNRQCKEEEVGCDVAVHLFLSIVQHIWLFSVSFLSATWASGVSKSWYQGRRGKTPIERVAKLANKKEEEAPNRYCKEEDVSCDIAVRSFLLLYNISDCFHSRYCLQLAWVETSGGRNCSCEWRRGMLSQGVHGQVSDVIRLLIAVGC